MCAWYGIYSTENLSDLVWLHAIILWIWWTPSIICPIMPRGLYPGGLKTGELVHTSQSQDGIDEEFYDRTTTPDSSGDNSCADRGEDGK